MGFPVFFDTCTLYGEMVNDVILRLAEEPLFVPYWSSGVLEELERNLAPRIGEGRAKKRIDAMCSAFPDATVTGYDALIEDMTCDDKDRHVLAAAAYSPAETLVTFNLKDFPSQSVQDVGVELRHPDDFLQDVLDLDPGRVSRACYAALLSNRLYPQTPVDYADMLSRSALPNFANSLLPLLETLHESC